MASVADALNSKPPLGAALAQGVRTLSMDQQIHFNLYQRYVFPLDGMVYWIKVPSSANPITTPGIQAEQGLATETVKDGEAIQVSPGSFWGENRIVGGKIINPLSGADQGDLPEAESLFVDFTGPSYSYVTATTFELQPGDSVDIPAQNASGAWVTSAHGGHKFTCIIYVSLPSVVLPTDVDVQGSFHYASVSEQREDATVDANEIIFTSLSEIQAFNIVGPNNLYIGTYGDLTFAFSSRGRLYEQADLYHYQGTALRTTHGTQIISDPSEFDPTVIPSNSLPIWLSLSSYVPPYPTFNCPIPLYPSYLVDDNLPPPFGSVHVEDTKSLAMIPFMGPKTQTAYLCRDKVKIHLYGLNAEAASDFMICVENYSRDWNTIGFANSPVIHDEKNPQSEFKVISQHKSIEYEVNYLQTVVRDIARQFILHAKVQFYDPAWFTDAALHPMPVPERTSYAPDDISSDLHG
jgi:hypothetical protein